jgi:xylulokinase
MSYFIGIDTSTTATKALLMDDRGNVLGVTSNEYSFETPQPLWSEQDPALWWHATAGSIRQVLAKAGMDSTAVKGIGLTGQMHGLVLLDESGDVLRPAILWNDQRTGPQCDAIRSKLGREKLIQITGNDALTGFTAPKILWVQEHEPEIWKRARHILLPKDYVRYKLTGEFASDRAGGAGTILFDLAKRDWSPEVLSALDIPAEYLPKTYEGTEVTGTLSNAVADELGLPADIPVFGGGGDQAAAAVGTGAVKAGVVSLSLGTSGVVFATTDGPFIESEGRLHAFCHSVPGKWHLMGVMLSAAGSLRWHRDTFAAGTDYDTLLKPAADVPAGSDGLFFLPYLTGERTPHPDPLARGAFVGLTVRHSFPHLTRSVLEGVSYGLRDSFELMKSAGLEDISEVRVTGGGARSPLWRQILADVFGAEIVTVNAEEGAAYGAALLAATGLGAFGSVESACDETIQITGSTSPGKNQKVYEELYLLYRELYPALKPSFFTAAV